MPVDLAALARPGHTAVLTMEIQRGVVGDLTSFPQLADAAARVGVVPTTARLLHAARRTDIPVIHCTAEFRADRKGSTVNCQLIAAMVKNPDHLLAGTPPCELVPELGPEPSDLVCARLHGVSPFSGTSLDAWLRSLDVDTVIATGVSVTGMAGQEGAVFARTFWHSIVLTVLLGVLVAMQQFWFSGIIPALPGQ